ncbi:hypothetical protein E2C01_000226 [Portunus trituberculatus]|uniref:Uncharacterized protein n=1 Tax=Portunus trituberculatus TaxID=210409 RepID=A0A5B7CFY8_PORTR|nr:hypothetical protein [Portunus trituberculatus]
MDRAACVVRTYPHSIPHLLLPSLLPSPASPSLAPLTHTAGAIQPVSSTGLQMTWEPPSDNLTP